MILIAAHPRSAQNYISRVLSTTNKQIGVGYSRADGKKFFEDDVPVKDGVVSFSQIRRPDRFDVILHQVRDPLKVISSSTTEEFGTYLLIFRTVNGFPKQVKNRDYDNWEQMFKENPVIPLWTWVHLNKAIDRVSSLRYRIEDIDQAYPEICRLLDIEPEPKVPDIPRDFNTRPHINYTWRDLESFDNQLCEEARKMAERYGYYTDRTCRIYGECKSTCAVA